LSRTARRWLGLLPASLLPLSCSGLIGLADLEKADCIVDCTPGTGAASAGNANGAGGVFAGGTGTGNQPSVGGVAGTTSLAGVAGSVAAVGGSSTAGSDAGGAGGEAPTVGGCPGGPEPPLSWTEHWFEHNQKLTRVFYDDCVALYFDADVPLATKDWLAPFIGKAWSYSLATYGKMGNERIYAVVHQGRYNGGHSSTFVEASHDNRAVIDMGATSWKDGDYDLPAHLLGFLVDSEGAHSKFGAPQGDHYENVGFPLIYKYDLYSALGLTSTAAAALAEFNAELNDQPFPDTYWFRDWFYPVWKDHGRAQVFANYLSLLEKYYPAGADLWMPTMNYGQYFHFMSGAAGVDLAPLARNAFEWHPDFDEEIAAAKADFPDIEY
jgi:hypothetical protein